MCRTPDELRPEVTSTATSVMTVTMETGRSRVSLTDAGRQLLPVPVSVPTQTSLLSTGNFNDAHVQKQS